MSDEIFKQKNKIQSSKYYPPPKQGQYYTVDKGMTLFNISIKTYGYDKTSLIIQANTILQSRPLDANNLPIVYQDDRIWLPQEVIS